MRKKDKIVLLIEMRGRCPCKSFQREIDFGGVARAGRSIGSYKEVSRSFAFHDSIR